jgi:diaminohydroxyphosphoribosylaminopyrimidine deaminase/5-amino-6-(5-phosphoribosylamino)uracil reductase
MIDWLTNLDGYSPMPTAQEYEMMRRALELAEFGRGLVEPNPLVGAVLVRDGHVVGEGWHPRFGSAHAEIVALQAAGGRARGATLYVTLEPCCHTGKTPPCVDAILHAGVSRVVAAMADPFPAVSGQGIEALRSAGVAVDVGLLEPEARALNAPYLKLLRTGRPWVIAKWAMTLDGKIATRTGDSKWITSEESRRLVHALRGRVDAIVVGIATVLADDPLLTARPPGPRSATRIILDRRLRLPLGSQLVRTAREAPVLIAYDPQTDLAAVRALQAAGCECLPRPEQGDHGQILGLLDELGRRRFTNVLVEGGSGVLGSFFAADEIDEVWAFVAPKLIGGKVGPVPVGGEGVRLVSDASQLEALTVESIGPDVLLRGRRRVTT